MSGPRITVHGGVPAFGVDDLSPFCLKLKTYLRMTESPYATAPGDPRGAPTRKVPYIVMDGATLGDSGLIIEHLKRTLGDPLDARLTPLEVARGHVIRRTVEESLYWCLVAARWDDDANWPEFSRAFGVMLPALLRRALLPVMRGAARKSLWSQGLGRHTREHREAIGCADIAALGSLLGEGPYLFGDTPTSFDATLFAVLASILAFPPQGHLAREVRKHPNLVALVDRVNRAWWAESTQR